MALPLAVLFLAAMVGAFAGEDIGGGLVCLLIALVCVLIGVFRKEGNE